MMKNIMKTRLFLLFSFNALWSTWRFQNVHFGRQYRGTLVDRKDICAQALSTPNTLRSLSKRLSNRRLYRPARRGIRWGILKFPSGCSERRILPLTNSGTSCPVRDGRVSISRHWVVPRLLKRQIPNRWVVNRVRRTKRIARGFRFRKFLPLWLFLVRCWRRSWRRILLTLLFWMLSKF